MANDRRKWIVVGFLVGSLLTGTAALIYKQRADVKRLFGFAPSKPTPKTVDPDAVPTGGGEAGATFRIPTPPWKVTPDNIEIISADAPITASIDRTVLKDGMLDAKTVSEQNVGLVATSDGSLVPATVTVNAAGDAITIAPKSPLKPEANYVLHIGNGIKLTDGAELWGHTSAFYTMPAGEITKTVRFENVPQQSIVGGATAMHFGPDGKLYASTARGELWRFPVSADGTLGTPEKLPGITGKHGKPRIFVGFVFDPKSTAENPIIYGTHTPLLGATGRPLNAIPNWSAMLSRLSGPNLDKVDDVLVNLPRSYIDHQTFEPVWGPDGALYFHQGAQNSFGYPDETWGWRGETPLTASVLRLDLSKWTPGTPIDVKTPDGGGTYDPAAPGAPLTVYASGIRVAYNIRFHSNGKLYAAVNGSSAFGNAPAGPETPPLPQLPMIEHDWLFEVRPGAYYGHPNPSQKHFVLNGGNPTAAIDPFEVPFYPVGTKTDSAYRLPIMDVGRNISANGTIEYQNAATFGGKLKGKLLICRYNVGSDVIVVGVDGPEGRVSSVWTQLQGAKDLKNPLSIVEDPKTGNVYVSEFGITPTPRITLLRPVK
jgi:glucose/arabinose dehydrogenase